jgi:ParB family transcriptional regulator, chromosome partitioning protein
MGQGNLDKLAKGLTANRQAPIESKGSPSVMPLDSIKDRANGDTRILKPKAVESLTKSIAKEGLINPLTIDSQGCLIAGGHRRAALYLLRSQNPGRFKELFGAGINVRVFGFDSSKDRDQALSVEVAENEVRSNYSKADIIALSDRLKVEGFEDIANRPKPGQKPLRQELVKRLGISSRRLRQVLNDPLEDAASKQSEGGSVPPLSPLWVKRRKELQKWREATIGFSNGPEITEAIDRLLRLLEDADRPQKKPGDTRSPWL